jgi:catechol 2,3-dioxygenase
VTARPRAAAGLFHLAFLVPERIQLGEVLLHLGRLGWPLDGASDHGVSEALYLSDPDGNGVEIYADRDRRHWPRLNSESVAMFTRSLDLEALIKLASDAPAESPLRGVQLGHVHLEVRSLAATQDFFATTFGFHLMQQMPGAVFLAADGYHHHIGANTWNRRSQHASADSVGLTEVNVLSDRVSAEVLHVDPDGNHFRVRPVR